MKQFSRPQKFNFEIQENLLTAEANAIDIRRNENNQIVDINIAPTLNYTNQNEKNQYILTIDPEAHSEKQYHKFNQLTFSLGKMARLAELNCDNLRHFVKTYLSKNDFLELIKRNSACKNLKYTEKPNIDHLTFENLRNIFSCILKSDKNFHTIDELKTGAERNTFTKMYNDYITDRNFYTHGILFLKYPDFEPVLRVVMEGEDNQIYLTISNEIIYDNLEMFAIIRNNLEKIQTILDSPSYETI